MPPSELTPDEREKMIAELRPPRRELTAREESAFLAARLAVFEQRDAHEVEDKELPPYDEQRIFFRAGLLAARVVERPDEGPADDAICRCGHTAHWHAAVIWKGKPPSEAVKVPQGAGCCDYNSECGCERFGAVAAHQPAEPA